MKLKTIILLAVSIWAIWRFLKWQKADGDRKGLEWSFLGS